MVQMVCKLFHLRVFLLKLMVITGLLGLVSCQNPQNSAMVSGAVKISRVVSGQTVEILGTPESPNIISQVRLIGLDAPDLSQKPWGEDSKKFLESLLGDGNKEVILEFDLAKEDKNNRMLAYLWEDKKLVNEEMIKEGYGLFVGRSPNHKYDQRLEYAQQWARIMGKGIWNIDRPMRITPGEFRRLYR
ncbi:thermonuclease family protein [Anabaena sp. FACHB-1237]|nr:thermonuclease family protein [Anabaena sp. FACHB-1237]